MAPAHRAGRQGIKQDPPKLAPWDFGTTRCTVIRIIEEQATGPVHDARLLATLVDDGKEVFVQLRRRRGFCFVDRDRDAVYVQNARKNQTAEAGSNNRDGSVHRSILIHRTH